MIFDPQFKFNAHVKSLVIQAVPHINILKAAPIWFPNTSPSLIQKFQTIQNSALCIATGCVKMASIDHLHDETKMLPVQDHISLILS